jgi:hypothetical protein
LIFRTPLTVIRALWFAVSIISSIWFLYWICYEALIWNKVLTQATPINYIAFVLSITLIIIGTQLRKISIFTKPKLLPEQNFLKNSQEKNQTQHIQREQNEEQPHQVQHSNEAKSQTPQNSKTPDQCRFYLGYLHKRPKSENIPEECLQCDQMVDCILK